MTDHPQTDLEPHPAPGAQEAPEAEASRPTLRAWYALTVVIIATLFGVVDRQILVLVTEPLKREMHISDVQIGVLQGIGPGLFAAIGVVALGWLADRTARQNVLAVCIVLWSLATAACGLAQSFHQLLFAGVAIGLGEAALGPVFYSMVPDLFPGKSRMTANLINFGATIVGAGVGVALSGAVIGAIEAHRASLPGVLAHMSSWRLAFLIVAAPGALIAAAVALIGPVARRYGKAAREAGGGLVGYFRDHWRTAAGFYLAIGLYGMALFATMAWMPVMVIRVLHASPTQVGYGFGLAFAVGSIAGIALAGTLAKLLRGRFGIMAPMRIFQGSLLLALLPILLLLLVTQPWQAYVLIAIQLTACTTGTALTPTMLQDMAPGAIRGQVIAFNSVPYALMGSMGPVLIGAVSDHFAGHPQGLLWSMVIVSVPTLAAASVLLMLVDRPFRRTINAFAPV